MANDKKCSGAESSESGFTGKPHPLESAMRYAANDFIYSIEQAYVSRDHDGDSERLPTGLKEVDRILRGGLKSPELIAILGEDASSNLSFALNIAKNVAATKSVVFFSLQKTRSEIVQRWVSLHTKVDQRCLLSGQLGRNELPEVFRASAEIARGNLLIDDCTHLTVDELASRALDLKRHFDIQLIVVDCLQLLQFSSGVGRGTSQELSKVGEILRNLAGELRIPILGCVNVGPQADPHCAEVFLPASRGFDSIYSNADLVAVLKLFPFAEWLETSEGRELSGADQLQKKRASFSIIKSSDELTDEAFLTYTENYFEFQSRAN